MIIHKSGWTPIIDAAARQALKFCRIVPPSESGATAYMVRVMFPRPACLLHWRCRWWEFFRQLWRYWTI